MISVIVLGAGAGGGFPQWNSNAPACRRARANDPAALTCTQTSIAVSADNESWFLLNAAPDLRMQIERTPELHPSRGLRSTPIAGVLLAGAEIDAITGLLTMREGARFTLYAPPSVLGHLAANPIFEAVSRTVVPRLPLHTGEPTPLTLPSGAPSGLTATIRPVPGKVPLYTEGTGPTAAQDETAGIEITDGTARLLFIPGCAHLTPDLHQWIEGADCLFFDATLWTDDEMPRAGLSTKTGQAMGHMSLSGPAGVMAQLRNARVARRILIHINNSNPVLLTDSPERHIAEQAGWQIAHDGMRIRV